MILILKQNLSNNWKAIFEVPISHLIKFNIKQWYKSKISKTKYNKRLYKYNSVYLKSQQIFSTSFQLNRENMIKLFKEHQMHLQSRIGYAYYKIGQDDKHRYINVKVLNYDHLM